MWWASGWAKGPLGGPPSPEPGICDVKLDQSNVLEVCGAGDSLVGDQGCQEGLELRRRAWGCFWDYRLCFRACPGGFLEDVQGEGGGQAVERWS